MLSRIRLRLQWGFTARDIALCRRCEHVLDRTYFGRLRGHRHGCQAHRADLIRSDGRWAQVLG